MQLIGWLGLIICRCFTAASLVGVAIYFARSLIEARLSRSVQYEFDKKISVLKSEMGAESRRIDSDMRCSCRGFLQRGVERDYGLQQVHDYVAV